MYYHESISKVSRQEALRLNSMYYHAAISRVYRHHEALGLTLAHVLDAEYPNLTLILTGEIVAT